MEIHGVNDKQMWIEIDDKVSSSKPITRYPEQDRKPVRVVSSYACFCPNCLSPRGSDEESLKFAPGHFVKKEALLEFCNTFSRTHVLIIEVVSDSFKPIIGRRLIRVNPRYLVFSHLESKIWQPNYYENHNTSSRTFNLSFVLSKPKWSMK